jgi:hypothetical protein
VRRASQREMVADPLVMGLSRCEKRFVVGCEGEAKLLLTRLLCC